MTDGIARSARRIAAGALDSAKQIRRLISHMLDEWATARVLFYGDDGKPRPEALDWLGKHAERNFVYGGGFDPDPQVHAFNAGRREAIIEMIESTGLDQTRLTQLRLMLRKEEGHG